MKQRIWLGLDGEGIGRTPHRYTLLAYSDGDGNSEYVEDPDGLSSYECLSFLVSIDPAARVAGYYLGYDWTMILRDLPDRSIYQLLRPELRAAPKEEGGFTRITWRGFRLHYLSGMMRIARGKRSVTIWDIGRYYQAPFVRALQQWQIECPIDDISAMKQARATFADSDADAIRTYCLSECQVLARLATELESAHVAIGFKPKSWHGPGSTASAHLASLRIQDRRGVIPEPVQYAAECAFFGGRFEQGEIGTVESVEGADIVGAYPSQIYGLPCLEHGTWEHSTRRPTVGQALVRYRLTDIGADMPWGPFPCRMPDGTILFPRGGSSGWIWLDELNAARERWEGVKFDREAWILNRNCDCHVFKSILDLYRERMRIGKDGRGIVLKLIYNSDYGKLAQTVGHPKYASRVWAGMITSGTRAQLLRLMAAHTDMRDVIALATDGLYSRKLPDLPPAPLAPDLLGSWERKEHGTVTFVRPGIYFGQDSRPDMPAVVRARGIGRHTLDTQRAAVLAAIDAGEPRADLGTMTAFGGARACVYRVGDKLKRSQHYGEWHEIPARISLNPAPKRQADWSLHMLGGVESAPYGVKSKDARTMKALTDLFWGMR